jgi:hypothetical protein
MGIRDDQKTVIQAKIGGIIIMSVLAMLFSVFLLYLASCLDQAWKTLRIFPLSTMFVVIAFGIFFSDSRRVITVYGYMLVLSVFMVAPFLYVSITFLFLQKSFFLLATVLFISVLYITYLTKSSLRKEIEVVEEQTGLLILNNEVFEWVVENKIIRVGLHEEIKSKRPAVIDLRIMYILIPVILALFQGERKELYLMAMVMLVMGLIGIWAMMSLLSFIVCISSAEKRIGTKILFPAEDTD